MAYESMLHGAQALLKFKFLIAPEDPDKIVEDFRTQFYDTEIFFDPFVRGKFAQDFFKAHEEAGRPRTAETAHQLIEEAQLFIEACYSCYARMTGGAREGHRLMDPDAIQHINLKIFVADAKAFDLADAVPIFHQWIRDSVCPGDAHRCGGLPSCRRRPGRAC